MRHCSAITFGTDNDCLRAEAKFGCAHSTREPLVLGEQGQTLLHVRFKTLVSNVKMQRFLFAFGLGLDTFWRIVVLHTLHQLLEVKYRVYTASNSAINAGVPTLPGAIDVIRAEADL